jgi:hypothetical protein
MADALRLRQLKRRGFRCFTALIETAQEEIRARELRVLSVCVRELLKYAINKKREKQIGAILHDVHITRIRKYRFDLWRHMSRNQLKARSFAVFKMKQRAFD